MTNEMVIGECQYMKYRATIEFYRLFTNFYRYLHPLEGTPNDPGYFFRKACQ